jgi:nucleotide-binding universal stress UspA family protein
MLQFQTILHATDFSEQSRYALALACSLARAHDARLILLHVWSPPLVPVAAGPLPVRPEDLSPGVVEEHLRTLQLPESGLRVERRLEQGNAASEVVRVAQETQSDLIVIGTHGRTGVGRLLMGSVAEEVVRRATCPVLAVKTPLESKTPVVREAVEERVSGEQGVQRVAQFREVNHA